MSTLAGGLPLGIPGLLGALNFRLQSIWKCPFRISFFGTWPKELSYLSLISARACLE